MPLPGIRIRLADDGEVLVSGPTVPEGWYHTGDLAVRDDMDRLTVTGRVIDAYGNPVRNAHVGVESGAAQTTTDRDGRFQITARVKCSSPMRMCDCWLIERAATPIASTGGAASSTGTTSSASIGTIQGQRGCSRGSGSPIASTTPKMRRQTDA